MLRIGGMPCPVLWFAPVRSSNELKKMTVRVFEIHPASTIVSINFASVVLAWVSPILNSPTADASEDLIEVVFAYQESIVLGGNFAFLLIEVE
jgi:hypothetical protein